MSRFTTLLIKLLEEVPQLTNDEVLEKIKDKKNRIGAGYLTNEGALYLIASDLGISLSGIETEKSEKKSETKTLEKTEESQEITNSDLENKYKTLSSARNRGEWIRELIPLPFLISIASLIYIVTNLDNTTSIIFVIAIISLIVSGSFLAWFFIKKPVPLLSKKEEIFIDFYKIFKSIHAYQYEPANTNLKKYQNKIGELADIIEEWTEDAPQDFAKLPNKVAKNLRKKIIPLFLNNNSDKIKRFIKTLEKLVFFLYNNEITTQSLSEFNDQSEKFPEGKIKKVIQKKSHSSKLIAGLIAVALVFGGIFYGILISMQMENSQALAYSVIGTIAVVALLINARKVTRTLEEKNS